MRILVLTLGVLGLFNGASSIAESGNRQALPTLVGVVIESHPSESLAIINYGEGNADEIVKIGSITGSKYTVKGINRAWIDLRSSDGSKYLVALNGRQQDTASSILAERDPGHSWHAKSGDLEAAPVFKDLDSSEYEWLRSLGNRHTSDQLMERNYSSLLRVAKSKDLANSDSVRCVCNSDDSKINARIVRGNDACAVYMAWMITDPDFEIESCRFL